jgi:hypothetical protein
LALRVFSLLRNNCVALRAKRTCAQAGSRGGGIDAAAFDWVDDPDEILTVVEAAALAEASGETIRRWCSENRIGRLFAGSLWLVSKHIEARSGEAAMLKALYRGEKMQRCLSAPQDSAQMCVGATS